jgi:hypothetical protein
MAWNVIEIVRIDNTYYHKTIQAYGLPRHSPKTHLQFELESLKCLRKPQFVEETLSIDYRKLWKNWRHVSNEEHSEQATLQCDVILEWQSSNEHASRNVLKRWQSFIDCTPITQSPSPSFSNSLPFNESNIMKNHVRWNHTTLQLKTQNNSYTTIMQLSFGYYN